MTMQGETYRDDNGRSVHVYMDNLLIRMRHHEKGEVRTPGGIIVPEQARAPKDRTEAVEATVVATGPGWHPGYRCPSCGVVGVTERTRFEESPVSAGDRVLVEDKDQGDVVMIGGVEHRLIRTAQVLAVLGDG